MGFASGMSLEDQAQILTQFENFLSLNGIDIFNVENILDANNSPYSTLDLAYLYMNGDWQTSAEELGIQNPVVAQYTGPEIVVKPKWWQLPWWQILIIIVIFILIIFLIYKAVKK